MGSWNCHVLVIYHMEHSTIIYIKSFLEMLIKFKGCYIFLQFHHHHLLLFPSFGVTKIKETSFDYLKAWEKTGLSFPFLIIFSLAITGSQRQPNIWSSSHDGHSWPSHILSANSCGSWSCDEQVSCLMPFYWNHFLLLFLILVFFYPRTKCISWVKIKTSMFLYQSFQHAQGFAGVGSGTGCGRDGKKSQSIDYHSSHQKRTHMVCVCIVSSSPFSPGDAFLVWNAKEK